MTCHLRFCTLYMLRNGGVIFFDPLATDRTS
jgi:hypothetical protein